MSEMVVALGSNLGDREATLRAAVRDIADIDGITVIAVSGLVESHALKTDGVDESAPSYLNAVLLAAGDLAPHRMLDELQRIELAHGRVRDERWGDRTRDLDLISVVGVVEGDAVESGAVVEGTVVEDGERLTLPHPRAWERAFVLAPWAELQPDAEIPGRGSVA
ncbi:MAG: 2-amino-4-hydroxy-6-hydroxymethyldihydropteridine diphosphokinase, partial [Microbacteriaceae bacterium]|nr:2-amino-4-hydroxy-6-hydroxymethyldihydropteridine diphosphokinase [Microbacteriaceae bacterium]